MSEFVKNLIVKVKEAVLSLSLFILVVWVFTGLEDTSSIRLGLLILAVAAYLTWILLLSHRTQCQDAQLIQNEISELKIKVDLLRQEIEKSKHSELIIR